MNSVRIFIVESPDPLDVLHGRSETPVIQAIAQLLGHKSMSQFVKSPDELRSACEYLSSLDKEHDSGGKGKHPLCLHLSSHGNDTGMCFGKETLGWASLLERIQSLFKQDLDYPGPRLLVLSACGAESQQVTDEFQKKAKLDPRLTPPKYVFAPQGDIAWRDSVVAWAVFYRLIADVSLDEPKEVRSVLDRIKATGVADFLYFRWDNQHRKYRHYRAKELA